MIGQIMICVYMLNVPMKNGGIFRNYPLLQGTVVKEGYSSYYVDFSKSLKQINANSYWNTKVVWVKDSLCELNK